MIDIVILSYAANEELHEETKKCLDSLFESEEKAKDLFNVYVLESQENVSWDQYPNTKTVIPPKPYGYHKFMNYGRKLGSSEYVCLCNNDLIFKKNWASEILNFAKRHPEIPSFSPMCPKTQPLYGIQENSGYHIGHQIRKHISGWCIFQRRNIYEIIGDLDERFTHWFSDNDYALTLHINHLPHCLVSSSIVEHHDKNIGKTGPTVLSEYEMFQATSGSQGIFIEKWKDLLR